jgi:hypothetical protein
MQRSRRRGSSVTEERDPRIESGSVVFGSDWPGLFLRGDDALHFAMHLRTIVDHAEKAGAGASISLAVVRGLLDDLLSVDTVNTATRRQYLRAARECIASTPTMRGPGPEESPDAKIEIR